MTFIAAICDEILHYLDQEFFSKVFDGLQYNKHIQYIMCCNS